MIEINTNIINIQLDIYNGPLDNLYNLISKKQIDISEIKLTDVTDQFLIYMQSIKNLDIEVSMDFVNIATRLIFIKSAFILDKHYEDLEALKEEEEELGKLLLQKMTEYKKYKDISELLIKKLNPNYYSQFKNRPEIIESEELDISKISLDDLHNAMISAQTKLLFRNIDKLESEQLKQVNERKLAAICHTNFISVEQKIIYLQNYLYEKDKVSFFKVTKDNNKSHTVATFLASLELAKSKEVILTQDKEFADITLERVEV